ncbi:MAG: hypothetical protein R2724_20280 [Bryobacterales bacterium]
MLGLLFLSIAVNLFDRQVLSLMAPLIRDELNLSNTEYSTSCSSSCWDDAVPDPGGNDDRPQRARFGMAVIMLWWSAANGLHALARNLWHFCTFRFLMGAGNAATIPAESR